MKLRSLSLQGFKSFADRTELHFHEGVTAIVGPNGCGKSNISDAIRWVLGEQRPSAIRGARMEEAIFQGTAVRRALNRAEVSMSFSNEEGRLALPQREVEIRRTVFREGGSDYFLNRQPTRLRDILDLCRDTGLGANAYTVIEQGMVDAILSDRAEERRHLFEEAAGVGRYKDRRKSAQRRLEAAEADLARLQDLVGEVETKVRSLARQRRRAQKYTELRDQRLSLEIGLAQREMAEVRDTLARTAARLDEVVRDDPGARAALTTVEAELERQRLEAGELARQRTAGAARREDISRRIAELERTLAVTDERRLHAERRLEQIATDRSELSTRLETQKQELDTLETEQSGQRGIVASLAERVTAIQERNATLRQEVTRVRRADEEARARETELTRALAGFEADGARADARAAEIEERLSQLDAEERELRTETRRLDEQGDLFAEQARTLAERRRGLHDDRAALEARLASETAAEAAARAALTTAQEAASHLTGRVEALERLERDFHGFAPAVAATLAARAELAGLIGPVADALRLAPDRGAALEAALGSLLQTLIVERGDAADRIRAWIADHHPDKGAVALLPRDALPRLEAFIEVLTFAGQSPSEPVLIGRQERLQSLRQDAARAHADVERLTAARAAAAAAVGATENRMRALQATIGDVDLELRRAEADESTRAGQRGRAERMLSDIARRRGELDDALRAAREEAATARAQHHAAEADLSAHRASWQEETGGLAEREAAWEAVRDEEAEIRVAHARAEGALQAIERRTAATREDSVRQQSRIAALDAEEKEHRASLETMRVTHAEAAAELESLFERREAHGIELRALEERLAGTNESMLATEARARDLRRASDERSELRHQLEMQRAESAAAERSVRERLQAEWGRPYDQLVAAAEPVDGDPEMLRAELEAVAADIERLGPINMLAMEEHAEESQRLEFLTAQRDDLVKARDDLQSAIRQINRTARTLFQDTFEQIRARFHTTFQTLFEGGECDIRLEDPEDPLETAIDIVASPRGKRTQRIHLLSGGERALTALALLFAIYLVKPSPFCVLDEVDAPLDEANIGRFIAMLEQFKASTQFIVITHNPRTMESADWLYGVTMEEPGISSIVGVYLDEVLTGTPAAES
ncbi:MAG: AAA family ATPase [Gemmatimonadetes bacterium]|nr:AAA family ATPase [Gemmatimonadota bacterium]